MDTGTDFIRPEFLNILFFQQKNLVIFPYVDVKHLHALELFTAGYTVIDLESTALHNIKEILEFEKDNSYSQNPTLFFISNVNAEKVKDIMDLDGIRCVINSNENISELAKGSRFFFFNKKSSQFLNYDVMDSELEFENYLISTSSDEQILQDKIQKIKIVATRIFKELNQSGDLKNLHDILVDYEKKYWNSILEFTRRFYDINIPTISEIKFKPRKTPKDFSEEYEVIISTNKQIGKEFIQLMHDYREKKVNPANLELEELFVPLKLYNYLRNHHWKEGIPQEFLSEWTNMENSGYTLSEEDKMDFEIIMDKLGLQMSLPNSAIIEDSEKHSNKFSLPPSPSKEWKDFKKWIINCLNYLKEISVDISRTSKVYISFLNQISELKQLLEESLRDIRRENGLDNEQLDLIAKIEIKIKSKLDQIKLQEWIDLYKLSQSKAEFIIEFFRQFANFHDKLFNVSNPKEVKMPIRIKRFNFPQRLERRMLRFNRFRNHIAHGQMSLEQREIEINKNQTLIIDTSLYFVVYIVKFFVIESTFKDLRLKDPQTVKTKIRKFIIENYVSNGTLSVDQVNKIHKFLQ